MEGEPKYGRVQEFRAPSETRTEYSSLWDSDSVKRDGGDLKASSPGTQSQNWKQSLQRNTQVALRTIPPFWQQTALPTIKTAWPKIKSIRVTKRQLFAFSLLWVCAIVPFIILGYVTGHGSFFSGVFDSKTLPCGETAYSPANNTVSGIEGLFVLDATYGSFPFSTVKIIDITWDVMVGRGAQLLAWWISYKVFSDAILRVIERHPTSYRVFFEICLHGPSFPALWTMLRDLFRTKSKRTWSLYFYMVWSIIYVITLPIMLSAMTGYTNTSIAWVDAEDTNEIIPASRFEYSPIVYGAGNDTLKGTKCITEKQSLKLANFEDRMEYNCTCRLDNGTITTQEELYRHRTAVRKHNKTTSFIPLLACDYRYPGQNGTFLFKYYSSRVEDEMMRCDDPNTLTFDGKQYNLSDFNSANGYCYNNRGYLTNDVLGKMRCLPDTQNPSYRWGFSTMLSGVFVIVNLVWSLTMYVVWLDAQFFSKLVGMGYTMTPLRAAFTLATVARRKMGCGNVDLVRADTKNVEDNLFGNRSRKIRHQGAEIEYGLFNDDGKEGGEMMNDAESGLRQRKHGVTAFDT